MPSNAIPNIPAVLQLLQKEAYAAIGMNLEQVQAFFQAEKERVRDYLEDKPDYLRPRADILEEDPSLDYIELNLVKRFDAAVPTDYQHPYLYTWLQDSYRYHCEKTYDRVNALDKDVVLATAPTGRLNALALAGQQQHGILFEDGLLNVVSGLSNLLAPCLYDQLAFNQFLPKSLDQVKQHCRENEGTIIGIAEIIRRYVLEGYSRQPPPYSGAYRDDFSMRNLLSSACFDFIFEHELHHLRVADGEAPGVDQAFLDRRFEQVKAFFRDQLSPHLPLTLSDELFRTRYLAHQEELFADYFAADTLYHNSRPAALSLPVLQGILLFFLAAILIEYVLFLCTDPQGIENLYAADALTISLTAIVMGESHPYAFARQAGLLSGLQARHPEIDTDLQLARSTFDFLATELRQVLQRQLTEIEAPHPHPKWQFGKSLLSNYLNEHSLHG